MPRKQAPPIWRKPTALRLVEPEPARALVASHVPETPCLVAVDRSVSGRWVEPSVRHTGDDCYEVSGGGFTFRIGPVKRLGGHLSREVTMARQGPRFFGDDTVDLDVLAAVIAVCGGAVTWTTPPPVWWPHGGGKIG